jgi:hypothetical protein
LGAAKTLYTDRLKALEDAASALRSKRDEYLQFLEEEQKELDKEMARVKGFRVESWR